STWSNSTKPSPRRVLPCCATLALLKMPNTSIRMAARLRSATRSACPAPAFPARLPWSCASATPSWRLPPCALASAREFRSRLSAPDHQISKQTEKGADIRSLLHFRQLDLVGRVEEEFLEVVAVATAIDHQKILLLTDRRQHAMPGSACVVHALPRLRHECLRDAGPALFIRADDHQERPRRKRHESLT